MTGPYSLLLLPNFWYSQPGTPVSWDTRRLNQKSKAPSDYASCPTEESGDFSFGDDSSSIRHLHAKSLAGHRIYILAKSLSNLLDTLDQGIGDRHTRHTIPSPVCS